MRHGLTFAELALFINTEFDIGVELEVVAMQGWQRHMYYTDTGLPWVFPSPNMPSAETAMVYPGQVIWEGTNISEGRGTTLPFELFGAPFIQHAEVMEFIEAADLPGCFLRPLMFLPTSGKWGDQVCNGFQLHVTNSSKFMPYRTSLTFLQTLLKLYPDEFYYKDPPYEYEFELLPMDLILGSARVRKQLEAGTPVIELEKSWCRQLEEYDNKRKNYFLYSL